MFLFSDIKQFGQFIWLKYEYIERRGVGRKRLHMNMVVVYGVGLFEHDLGHTY